MHIRLTQAPSRLETAMNSLTWRRSGPTRLGNAPSTHASSSEAGWDPLRHARKSDTPRRWL